MVSRKPVKAASAGGSKRGRVDSNPVSKKELLKELGHPSTWGKNDRKIAFETRLHRGEEQLDIGGIVGYSGRDGYLFYLVESLAGPLSMGQQLVSKKEAKRIIKSEIVAIAQEIMKIKRRFAILMKDPAAVERYINDMKRALASAEKATFELETDEQLAEHLNDQIRLAEKENALNVHLLRIRIKMFSELLMLLRTAKKK